MKGQMHKLLIDDTVYETEIPEKGLRSRYKGMPNPREVRAIIPGTVIEVKVRKGQRVSEGQVVLILEAMKMYKEVEAKTSGKIEEISVSPGDRVEKGLLMIRIGNE
jgi:biotin carboxyl carrier protein